MILEKVTAIVVDKLGVDAGEVKLESTFRDDLGADSLDLFEVIMSMEEEFNITIENEDAEKIITVEDAVNYIKEKQ